jgi:ABC-type Na+ transport system ATPase subunit NatA
MLSVDHRSKRYGTVVAVDVLSFQVGPGRITGFLRPNSAGNTTTVRTLLSLVAPNQAWARHMHDTAQLPPVRFLGVASPPPPGSSSTANPERTIPKGQSQ